MAKSQSSIRWDAKNIVKITCSIPIKTGIPVAAQIAADEQGVTRSAYVTEALRQRLVKEGYLQRTLPGDSELNRE